MADAQRPWIARPRSHAYLNHVDDRARKFIERNEMVEILAEKISTMPNDTAVLLYSLIEEAAMLEENAGYSGAMNDGGCGRMIENVEMFVHGWFKSIPREWSSRLTKLAHKNDPDWQEYQRLRKKFGE